MSKQHRNNLTQAFTNWFSGSETDRAASSIHVELHSLEDRVLYSAGPIPMEQVDLVDNGHVEFVATDHSGVEANFELITDAIAAFESLDEHVISSETSLDLAIDPNSWSDASQEIVFVDTSVEGHELLVQDILNQRIDSRTLEVIYLTDNSNAIQRVAQTLENRTNVDAIHLISHGADGELRL